VSEMQPGVHPGRLETENAGEDKKGERKMPRGVLNEKIQELAKEFLKREITVLELRMYPYLDHVMKNNQKLDPNKINTAERKLLAQLRSEGHIEGGMTGLAMTKEFYDYINQVLWYGYVVDAYNPIADALGIKSGTG